MTRALIAAVALSWAAAAGLSSYGGAQQPPPPVERPRQPTAPRPAPPRVVPKAASRPQGEVIAITGARVMTVSGDPIARGTVLIAGTTIQAVGADVQVPPGARVIDAAGKVITPGWIDSATQIGLVEISLSAEGTADQVSTDPRVSAAFNVLDAYNPNSTVIPITRLEGITRAVVLPAATGQPLVGQGALVDLSGAHVPYAVTRGPVAMLALLGESGAAVAGGSRATAMIRLREALQDALDYAGNRAAFNTGQRRQYAPSRLDLAALVPVVRGELPLAIQAHRASDLLAAMRLADEFKLRVVLMGAAEGWMVADEIARRSIPVVIKPLTNLPTFDTLGATLENAARLSRAGATVALASFDTHNARNLRQEAGNAIAYGMDRNAALQAVTLVPARIWGVADRLGSLQPARDADLVIWSGDPFELTTRAERVFIRGREMPPDTRQRRMLERYRDLSGLRR